MIATITPDLAQRLTIPATPELLDGWVGPIQPTPASELWTVVATAPGRVTVYHPAVGTLDSLGGNPRMWLPLSRPEVRDRVVRAGAAGDRVPCPETWTKSGQRVCLCGRNGDHGGYLRPPADLSTYRDGPALTAPGWTSAELSAALLWVSWGRLAGGMGAVGTVWPAWHLYTHPLARESAWGFRAPLVYGPIVGYTMERAESEEHARRIDAGHISGGCAVFGPDSTLTAIVPDGTEVPQ